MKRIQLFNSTGIKGVIMWVAGPLVSAAGHAWATTTLVRGEEYPLAATAILVIGGLTTLISVPMMLIGREQHEV